MLPENSGKKSLVGSLVQQPENNRAFIQYYSFSQTPSQQAPDNGTLFGAVSDEFAYSDYSEVDLSSATTLRAFLDMLGQTSLGREYEKTMLVENNLDSFIEATEAVAQVNANSGSNYRIAQ